MRVLALDTTTRTGSVAVVDAAGTVWSHDGDGRRSHAERLPGDLLELLREAGLTLDSIDLFAVVSGPGGFTGLRVGIAAMQGLAFVADKRIVAVPTLRALAAAVADRVPVGERIGVWMDARRGEVFTALWEVTAAAAGGPQHLLEIEPADLALPAAAAARWGGRPPSLVVGDGAVLYASTLSGVAPVVAPPSLAPVVGRMAIAYATAGVSETPAGVQLVYVRRPDAEVARDERARINAVRG